VGGANPSGSIVAQTFGSTGALSTFHGDVAQGCVLVQGNQAAIIGLLPADEQFTFLSGGGTVTHLVKWVDVVIQDNGASGDDSAVGLLSLNESTGNDNGANYCNGTTPWISPPPPPPAGLTRFLVPADSGDYSFTYGDTLDNNPDLSDVNLTIVNSNGLPVTVTDAPDPAGLDVMVGATSGTAVLSACGYEVDVAAGSEADISCGSVIVQVVHGSATVVLGGGTTTVSVPAGGQAEVSGDASTGFTVQNEGSTPVTVTVDGTQVTVPSGQTGSVAGADWSFQGFSQPLAALPVLNTTKAGSVVPFKWHLLDASGAPVTNLVLATLTVSARNCSTGVTAQSSNPTTILGGLQNLGNGYYQLNWKTPASFAGTCQTSHLDVGGGVTHDAAFSFKS
jgi:hypothetical protein